MQPVGTAFEEKILKYLQSHGPSRAEDIRRYFGLQRSETYNLISSLICKGLVVSTFERPQKYSAKTYASNFLASS
jgi:sugar-specific transcriptional regulator TrmB